MKLSNRTRIILAILTTIIVIVGIIYAYKGAKKFTDSKINGKKDRSLGTKIDDISGDKKELKDKDTETKKNEKTNLTDKVNNLIY